MTNEFLTSESWSIIKLFEFQQYVIPVYQRPYSWNEEQINTFLQDISSAYDEYKKDPNSQNQNIIYMGNMILHLKSHNTFDVIDGQQRITTFVLLILALYAKSYDLNMDPSCNNIRKLREILWKTNPIGEPVQEKPVLTLGSVDKDMFSSILKHAFCSSSSLEEYITSYNTHNAFEKNIQNNFKQIYQHISQYIDDQNSLLYFINFILKHIIIVAITTKDSDVKAFSIFESINSKGKQLEVIDLIKTHIFSSLPEAIQQSYLQKWGQLIIETNDCLYKYLMIYIKSYIKYYKTDITFNNFKKLDNELCQIFHVSTISEAYTALIDDMVKKLCFYNALSRKAFSIPQTAGIFKNPKLKFYYYSFLTLGYEHPKSLFFRAMIEYHEGKLSKEDLTSLIIETTKLMIVFLTISQKDSKDLVGFFADIFSSLQINSTLEIDLVLYKISTKLKESGINPDNIYKYLTEMDMFDKNKKLGVVISSVYESKTDTGNLIVSWDEAYAKLNAYGTSLSLDHIMNQTPDKNDPNLKYYEIGKILHLKEGHDFPKELAFDGMEYDLFKKNVLHRIGNLTLMGKDSNSAKHNTSSVTFYTYKSLVTRTNEIINFITQNLLNVKNPPKDYTPNIDTLSKKSNISGNYDLTNIPGITNVKVTKMTIESESYDIKHNINILQNILSYIYKFHDQNLVQLAKENWAPRNRTFLCQDPTLLKNPYELINGQLYMEANLNSNDIIEYSKILADRFKLSKTSVTIYIP